MPTTGRRRTGSATAASASDAASRLLPQRGEGSHRVAAASRIGLVHKGSDAVADRWGPGGRRSQRVVVVVVVVIVVFEVLEHLILAYVPFLSFSQRR